MKITKNISAFFSKALILLSALSLFIFAFADSAGAETIDQTYYKNKPSVQANSDIQKLLTEKNLDNIAYALEILRRGANGNFVSPVILNTHDLKVLAEREDFKASQYGEKTEQGTYAHVWDFYEADTATSNGAHKTLVDSRVTDIKQGLVQLLLEALEAGNLTLEEAQKIELEANNLISEGGARADEAAGLSGKGNTFRREIRDGTSDALGESIVNETCPQSQALRAKYQSGCWSCLVVKNLTSAFLSAASTAYSLSQRAGVTLLWIGVTLWLLMWALKNVSSLAQVEPGNILNELIKFMFKVGIAYWFIMGGLPMVRNYFITPIMGFGATIAQQFWPEQFHGYVEEYKWDTMTDEDIAEQEKELKEILSTTPVPTKEQEKEIISVPLSETDKEFLSQNDETFAQTETGIPNLLIPGIQTGCLSSPFGCRKRPCAGCSKAHHGVDIGLNCVGKRDWAQKPGNCVPVIAAGPGIISYKGPDGNGAGFRATINHGKIGKYNWATRYFHMKEGSGKFKNGDKVSQGQPIGCVGSTGVGTATHLHFEVHVNGTQIDPLSLPLGKVQFYDWNKCSGKEQTYPQPSKYKHGAQVGSGWPATGKAVVCMTANVTDNGNSYGSSSGKEDFQSLIIPIDEVTFTDKDPTDIMPKSVMNSILGATKAITNITAENMILGDAIMCYATMKRGGAWNMEFAFGLVNITITNAFMWIEGFIIFCFGLLLTMAIVYYLMDMSFKIGFAVIALPIVVGLWPFNMTKGKFSMCVSIIAKGAATFAFLALTTTYTVNLTEAVINWGDTTEKVTAGEGGISKLYTVMDEAGNLKNMNQDRDEDNYKYAAEKLSLFSTTFVLLLFAFLYSFKLVQNTVPDLVNKFFPDKAFGETNPMHQWATAATRWAKDQAMKPVGYARDIALNQAGNALKGMPGKAVGFAKSMVGKGSGDAKTAAGSAMRGIGGLTKFAGKAMSAVGMKGAGGKVQAAGQKIKNAGDATDKAYNDFGTRNKKSDGDKKE